METLDRPNVHIEHENRHRRPQRDQFTQQALERNGLAVGVDAKLDDYQARRCWVWLPKPHLPLDAVLEKGWTRRWQRTIVMGNELCCADTGATKCLRHLSMVEP